MPALPLPPRTEEVKAGWISEEKVYAHYGGNKQKADAAMREAEAAGRASLNLGTCALSV